MSPHDEQFIEQEFSQMFNKPSNQLTPQDFGTAMRTMQAKLPADPGQWTFGGWALYSRRIFWELIEATAWSELKMVLSEMTSWRPFSRRRKSCTFTAHTAGGLYLLQQYFSSSFCLQSSRQPRDNASNWDHGHSTSSYMGSLFSQWL